MLFLLFSLLGCSSKQSSIQQPPSIKGCGWAVVNSQKTVQFLGLKTTESIMFYDQLYYCCPGQKTTEKPTCREAKWYKNKILD